jgi:hypothetical protein
MIDSRFHIELNGKKYRVAFIEDSVPVRLRGEPMRPPNAQIVQGEAGSQFQMRPDQLVWLLTDWSGGMGKFRFSEDEANRPYVIQNLDVITTPGQMKAGPASEYTKDSVGAQFTKNLQLTRAMGGLWGVDEDADDVYEWDDTNERWKAAVDNPQQGTGTVGADFGGVAGDERKLYYKDENAANIYSYDGTSFVVHNSDTGSITESVRMVSLGDYLYLYDPACKKQVFEIPKSGTPPVTSITILDLSNQGGLPINKAVSQMVAGDNRVYVMQGLGDETVIWEIVPTSSAGAGYGQQLVRVPGFKGEALWFHLGFLYMLGTEGSATDVRRIILYLDPGGEYGTLGDVNFGDPVGTSDQIPYAGELTQLTTSGFVLTAQQIQDSDNFPSLYLIDHVSGGLQQHGVFAFDAAGDPIPSSGIEYNGMFFITMGVEAGVTKGVMRTIPGSYSTRDGYYYSPIHDFGLAEQKILMSHDLMVKSMPVDWNVIVQFAYDGGAWSDTLTYSVDGGTGVHTQVSTDSVTRTFRELQVRVRFQYTGAGTPTTTPTFLGLQLNATVTAKVRVWRARLDLSNEDAQLQGFDGPDLITNIKTSGDLVQVVDFKNGFEDPRPGVYEQVDVVIDDYEIILKGGDLTLEWREADDCVTMTGPAVELFTTDWPT